MIEENVFKKILFRIVEVYQLSPEAAKDMLLRILSILKSQKE